MMRVGAQPVCTRTRMNRHLKIALWLLGGLLALRFLVLGLGDVLYSPPLQLVRTTFELGTYLLTAGLIWWERERLSDFFIGPIALALLIAGPFLSYSWTISPGHGPALRWFEMSVAVLLVIALIAKRPRFTDRHEGRVVRWMVIGGVAGFFAGAILLHFAPRFQSGPRGMQAASLLMLIRTFTVQLSHAAVYEEPLFRGFLWGYLRKAGWKDIWILPFQAALFVVGHMYYLFHGSLFSFFVIVPVDGILFGLMAWRGRSIAASMVTHGMMNSGWETSAILWTWLNKF